MDTDSYIIQIEIKGFYKDIADDVGKIFNLPNYEVK